MDILREYAQFVESRAKVMPTHVEDLLHGAIGISGEAGELLDSIKKTWVYNKDVDLGNIKEELGDLLFYIQHVANTAGFNLEAVLVDNMTKLRIRYPSGYTDAAAQARADKQTEQGEGK